MSSSIIGMQEASEIMPSQKFEGHTGWVTGTIHLPDGQRMMTCSSDGSLRAWNLKTGKQIGDDWRDGESDVWTIALSPDGKEVVSGSEDGGVRLWDVDTGEVIAKWMGRTTKARSVCWSQDGRRIVSGYCRIASEWDVENGETILKPGPIITGHEYVYAVVYSPDMTMLATGGLDPKTQIPGSYESLIKVWDAKTGGLVAALKGHRYSVNCLAWTPDGKRLISGSYDSSIRTWNTTNWKGSAVLNGHTSSVNDIAISPNGRILASVSDDHTAQLWNLDNGQPISSPLHHAHKVNCVSFSGDGKLLATGCDDHNAYMWDVGVSLLAADATRRSVRRLFMASPRILRGFFDDTPKRAHLSAQHRPQPQLRPSASHTSTLRSRFLSLFRPIHPEAHGTPSRPRPFHWVRNRLSGKPSGAGIGSHSCTPRTVEVPVNRRSTHIPREKRRLIVL